MQLWHECELGPGAAKRISCDLFDHFVLTLPYFDRYGLIVAVEPEQERLVGFVHAGFAANEEGTALDVRLGVVEMIMVHPQWRGRGIGRELIKRAEQYLQQRGALTLLAGPATACRTDSFYMGLYGGAVPCGFLRSDAAAEPFFLKCGYEPYTRIERWRADLSSYKEPINYRLRLILRAAQAVETGRPSRLTWWWAVRFGRLDAVSFRLLSKKENKLLAEASVVEVFLFAESISRSSWGVAELEVPETERKKGYGEALLVEILRWAKRLQQAEYVETYVPESNSAMAKLVRKLRLTQVDEGVVYRKKEQ